MNNGSRQPNPRGQRTPPSGTRPRPNQAPPTGAAPHRQRPMPEREYRAYMQRQAATAAERKRQAEVEKMAQKTAAKRRRKRNRQVFLGRLAVFGVVLLIMAAISAGVFLILFHHTPDAEPEQRIQYTYGGAEVRTEEFETAYVNGLYYFCFQDLADYLGMAETGSIAERRFLFISDGNNQSTTDDDSRGNGTEEYVCFPDGEAIAIVNDQRVPLAGKNRLIGEDVWVCVDFIEEVMQNISVKTDNGVVAIAKIVDSSARPSTGDVQADHSILYLSPSFQLKKPEPLETIPETDTYIPETEEPEEEIDMELANVTFLNDLTAYEQYMSPADRDGYLILVNTKNTLSKDFVPTDLLDVASTANGRATQQLRQYANKALEALLMEMKSAGFTKMQVNSGYRNYAYQEVLFSTYTANEMSANPNLSREEAEKIVLTYSTRAGTSEHQTGLAVDMAIDASFSTDFQYTEEYKWLMENAWKFGFILRFPADKTAITTIQFEPWHWRYVGRYHAKKIHDLEICLEEYIELLNSSTAE